MSSPTDPQPTDGAAVRTSPPTQEIPVVAPATAAPQLPPHPAATTPAPVQTVQPTGPVGVVPGLPGPLPPPPAPASPASGSSAVGATASSAESTAVLPDASATGPVPPVDGGPAAEQPRTPARRDRTALVALGLVGAALVLLELGLALRFGGESFWSDIPLWSAFATLCTLLGLAAAAAVLPGGGRLDAATGWRVAAGGLTGLAVFWLLVALPVVASDRGFLLTAALGCLGGALWLGSGRSR
ncbi:hypothetical protein [Blastococcus sp. SYSU D01042]